MTSLTLVALALVVVALGLRYVPVDHAGLVERSGTYRRTLTHRVGWVLPGAEHLRLVQLRPTEVVLRPMALRSEDEVQLLASVRMRLQPLDPVRAVYQADDLQKDVELLVAQRLRRITGSAPAGELLRRGDRVGRELAEHLSREQAAFRALVDEVQVDLWLFPAQRGARPGVGPTRLVNG